ncbi:PTS system mannose/fructose/sorbose family transporter subunit IID [Rothia kristinae]
MTVQHTPAQPDAAAPDAEANATAQKRLTRRDYVSTYFRSTFMLGSFNFERMQAIGVCVSMIPAIRRFYTKKEDQAAALGRHLEFFNTQPWIASPIFGVTAAMERQKSEGEDISAADVTNVKVGLMGPLAGVGDPLFWGTARPVLAALGASLAMSGSILGPLLFFVVLNIIRIATRWYGFRLGYQKGVQVVSEVGGNTLKRLTQIASVMGLFVMGALVSKWTTVNIPFVLSEYTQSDGKHVTNTVQSVLDSLLPGLVPLLLTFLCMWLLRHKVNAIWIIFGMFAVGILGYWAGILAP